MGARTLVLCRHPSPLVFSRLSASIRKSAHVDNSQKSMRPIENDIQSFLDGINGINEMDLPVSSAILFLPLIPSKNPVGCL